MVILVIISYIILIIYEFVPLYKQNYKKDLWINAVLGTISFIVAILLSLDISIPSPSMPIYNLITSIFGKQG